MDDKNIRDAIGHWAPRMIANGIDYNEFVEVTSKVKSWADWCPEWSKVGARHEARAAQAEKEGNRLTAADAKVSASLAHHFGKFVWFEDPVTYREAGQATVRNYREAMALHSAPPERVAIPHGDRNLPGYLSKPAGKQNAPVVIIVCGLDSVKEEMHTFVPVFHARGIATLVFDGPGQGEAEDLPLEPAFERVMTSVVDWLHTRNDIDSSRLAAMGISLGGYYVARASAFETRLRCVAACGGAYHFGADFANLPLLTRKALMARSHSASLEEAAVVADRINLEGVASRISLPFLVIFGGRDRLFPPAQAERLFREMPSKDKEFALYPEGNHVCNNIPYIWRPKAADWIAHRLRT